MTHPRCPSCNEEMPGVHSVGPTGPAMPTPHLTPPKGDQAICFKCGAMLVVTGRATYRVMATHEVRHMPAEEQRNAVRAIMIVGLEKAAERRREGMH